MKSYYTIGEISKMFDVPSSSIRFWDDEGCIKLKREENGYRCFDLRAMIDLCRLMLYRDLEVPIKSMKSLPEMGTEDMNTLLEQTKQTMIERLSVIEEKIAAINEKQKLIKLQEKLEREPYCKADIPFEKIIRFRFADTALLKEYFKNQHRLVLVMREQNDYTPEIGFSVPYDYESDSVLWENSKNNRFICFLLKLWQSDIRKNDLSQHIDILRNKYTVPKVVIAQYIDTNLNDGVLMDYNCAWAAINEQ